jgi:uncharacterized protein YdcH (DUF465 family)
MSNYENEEDKLRSHYEELVRKHKELDEEIEARYNNVTVSEEVRRMKTMKLYLKDEMHRINSYLVQKGLE